MSSAEALTPPRENVAAQRIRHRLLLSASALELPAVVGVIVLAGLTRLYAIDSKGMWLDEAFSMFMARQPLGSMLNVLVSHDTAPPLYYALLHVWLGLGDSAFSARLLSTVLSVACVLAGYGLGRAVGGPWIGVASAVLLALSPFQVWYGQEARMYALLAALCAASSLLLLLALKRGGIRLWGGYVVTTALALYAHAVVAPFVLAEGLAVLAFLRLSGASWRPFVAWLKSALVVAALWLPWLPVLLRQGSTYQSFWIPVPTSGDLKTLMFEMTSAYLPHWRVPRGEDVLVAAGLILALLAFRRIPRPEYGFLLTLVVVPIVVVFLISQVRPIFLSRVLIYIGAPYLILLAAGAASLLPRWRAGLIVLGALVSLNVVSLLRVYDVIPKEEWRAVADQVESQATPGELVLFNASDTQIAFDYYATGAATSLDEHGLPFDVFTVGPLEPNMSQADPTRFEALVHGRASFWLIESHTAAADPAGLGREWARSVSDLVDTRRYTGVTVYHYVANTQASHDNGGSQ